MNTAGQVAGVKRGGHVSTAYATSLPYWPGKLIHSQTALRKCQEYGDALKAYERQQGIPEGGVTGPDGEKGLQAQWLNLANPSKSGPEWEAMVVEQLNWFALCEACDPEEGQFYEEGLTADQLAELEAWRWKSSKSAFSAEEVQDAKDHLWETLI